MALVTPLFQIEHENDILILTPESQPLEFVMRDLQEEMDEILATCECHQLRNLLIDFPPNDFVESMGLGFLVSLHKRVTKQGGKVVCCCGSRHIRQILATTRLDCLFPVFDSRDEAMNALEK